MRIRTNISFKIIYFLFGFLFWAGALHAQTVSGVVTDASSQETLPGVNILVKGSSTGTSSDSEGKYELTVPSLQDTLVFSFVGYETQEIPINGRTAINVQMQPKSLEGEELVVVGYGVQQKSDLTGAISSVSSADFNKGVGESSPGQLLQGKVAGVNVTSKSGEPGAAQSITIRGPGSVRSGNTPLFVVDGVPLSNTDTAPQASDLGLGSSGAVNPLSFLNPEDIKSIDVLKDASATAIYGSRGSNGVIVITTKRGSAGAPQISYNGRYSISQVGNRIDLLTPQEFIDYQKQYGDPSNIYENGNAKTNWQDQIFRTAITQNQVINFSGGSQNTNYYASFSALNQDGVVKNSSMKKYTGRINIDQNFLDDRFNVKLNLTGSYTRNDHPPIGDAGSAEGDLLSNALNANPTYPVYNSDGNPFHFPNGFNPVNLLNKFDYFSKVNRVLGNVEASFDITKNLEYKINFGVDHSLGSEISQIDPHDIVGLDYANGRLDDAQRETNNIVIDHTLTYKYNSSRHNVNILGGYSYQENDLQSRNWSINDFSTTEIQAYHNPGIGTSLNIDQNRPGGSAYKSELQSFFGRLNYDYLSRYLITATVRADGSSKFGKDNKYGLFPSFSVAWRLSNENFMSGIDVLSNLKLRVGWGQTGNQAIPTGITKRQLSVSNGSGSGYPIGGTGISPGYNFIRTPNPDIKWEVSTQTNVGLDFSLFQNNLYGSIDYFDKVSSDILWRTNTTPDPINPTSEFWNNYNMKILNKGIELSLGYRHSYSNDFSWNVSGNLTRINNKVKDLPVSILSTGFLNGPGLTNVTVNGYLNGEPIGTFYLLDFKGFDENGQNIYRDVNNDGTINDADRIVAGTALPNIQYGLSAGVNYKNFDLSLNLNGVSGSKIYNNTANAYFNYPIFEAGNNVSKAAVNNTNESSTNSATPSTRFLEDGSYLRLDNATIGYNVKAEHIQWLQSLRVYVTGQNLFVITDYGGFDPEVNTPKNVNDFVSYGIDYTSYPKARTFMFGINLSL